MNQQLQAPALLVYFPDEDPGNQDAAVLLVLGEGAPVLVERFSDFVLSLPGSNWTQQIGRLAVQPLNKDYLLNVGHLPTRGDEFAVSLLAGFPIKAHPTPYT